MKNKIFIILLLLSQIIYSKDSLGLDSGKNSIELYNNDITSNIALIIIGGIHGDERETSKVVTYLKNNLNTNIETYYIPSINPTIYDKKINRRGYLSEHLDNNGFVKDGIDLTTYNKGLYYRIFYGNNSVYNNGISHYIDPNRDFIDKKLPSTRLLIKFISDLSTTHKDVIILSIHGFMSGGRVYPEYNVISDEAYIVNERAWSFAKIIGENANYIPEKMYSPAIPILDRFKGEFIAYTGKIDKVTALDIELDSSVDNNNNIRTYNGIKALITYLSTLEEE